MAFDKGEREENLRKVSWLKEPSTWFQREIFSNSTNINLSWQSIAKVYWSIL